MTAPDAQHCEICGDPMLWVGYESCITRATVTYGEKCYIKICPACDQLDHWTREKVPHE